tara:strand:+ start:198 stop:377 length:180 start_codon:yes stop_codon:yes gene_type:complete
MIDPSIFNICHTIERELWKYLRLDRVAGGYSFIDNRRDLTFLDKNGKEYEITIKKIEEN